MQLYIDQNGIQQLAKGKVAIDEDTGEPFFRVVHEGDDIDPEKVGGYSVEDGRLVFSAEALAQHRATKQAAEKQAMLDQLLATPQSQTVEGFSERARILFALEVANATRAVIAKMDAVIMSNWTTPAELRTAWRAQIPAAPPQLNEQQVAALLAQKHAQVVGGS